ncbi:MAG: hypothetical protein ACYDCQ_04355 [Dehalococcoidia bacterium]
MTSLNAILGSQSTAILVLAVVGVVLLAAAAGTLDFLSGTTRVLSPLALSPVRSSAFIWLGLPAAFVLIGVGGLLGALTSGMTQTGDGTRMLLWLVNGAFLLVVAACGTSSPLARHWGLGIAAFAVGLGAIFPLLAVISALSFNESGLLIAAPDRAVFGIAIGGILLAIALCGCAIVSMACYIVERTAALLRSRGHVDSTAATAATVATRAINRGRPRA